MYLTGIFYVQNDENLVYFNLRLNRTYSYYARSRAHAGIDVTRCLKQSVFFAIAV